MRTGSAGPVSLRAMPIWNGAIAVLFERSSAGNTATVLGPGDALLASCDDAGTVIGADGSTLMTAAFFIPAGARSQAPGADLKALGAHVVVAGADGTPVGTLVIRRFTITPFSRKITIAMLDPGGAAIGELSSADRKGRELAVSCGGSSVASIALADRDRGIVRTVERWSLSAGGRPPAPCDLLVAAAILRHRKLLAAVSSPSH